jgi:hypothetical protein
MGSLMNFKCSEEARGHTEAVMKAQDAIKRLTLEEEESRDPDERRRAEGIKAYEDVVRYIQEDVFMTDCCHRKPRPSRPLRSTQDGRLSPNEFHCGPRDVEGLELEHRSGPKSPQGLPCSKSTTGQRSEDAEMETISSDRDEQLSSKDSVSSVAELLHAKLTILPGEQQPIDSSPTSAE